MSMITLFSAFMGLYVIVRLILPVFQFRRRHAREGFIEFLLRDLCRA